MADHEHADAVDRASARSDRGRRAVTLGLLVAATLAGLLTLAVVTGSHTPDGFDDALTDFTRGWADSLGWPVDVAHVIGLVTAPGWSSLLAFVIVAVLLGLRHRAAAALLALSALAGVVVTEGVKLAVGRTRPPGAELFESDLEKSFPSGHSSAGIYLYLATGLILLNLGRARGRRWLVVLGVALIIVGPMIGLSRLVLGVHWPTDVLGGWAFGSTVLLASALLLWDPLDRGWPRALASVETLVDDRADEGRADEGLLDPGRSDADAPIGLVEGDEGPYSGRPGAP